jgi:aminopeptidase-like protein
MVERYLTAACVKNGLISPKGNGLREVNQTIKSGIEAGLREQQSAQHVFGTHPDEWQDSYAYIEPLKANNASRVSTPSSRLGGS